jgi:hypothetical protein
MSRAGTSQNTTSQHSSLPRQLTWRGIQQICSELPVSTSYICSAGNICSMISSLVPISHLYLVLLIFCKIVVNLKNRSYISRKFTPHSAGHTDKMGRFLISCTDWRATSACRCTKSHSTVVSRVLSSGYVVSKMVSC